MGVDMIHPLFLHHGGDILISALHLLFSLSYSHSLVPSEWKIARGLPLYKGKGDRSSPSNYRMISITSVVARLFERLILDRCLAALPPNFLSPYQAGLEKPTLSRIFSFFLPPPLRSP